MVAPSTVTESKTRVGNFFSWSLDCTDRTSTQVLDCDWEITPVLYDSPRSASLTQSNQREIMVIVDRTHERTTRLGTDSASNPFGHSGIAGEGEGIYSKGTKHPFGGSTTEYLKDRSANGDVYGYIIQVDQTTFNTVFDAYRAYTQANPGYDKISNNCNTALCTALEAGGIVDITAEMFPRAIMREMENMVRSGNATTVPLPKDSTYYPPFLDKFNPSPSSP